MYVVFNRCTGYQSIKQSNFYNTNILGKARLSGVTAESVFNSKIEETQFCNINKPWGLTVSMGERPNQRDVSSNIS